MKEYIEREALLKKKPFTYVGGYLSSYNDGFLDCAEEARETIKNAPAADVAPVRHGKLNFVQEDMPYCNYGVCDVCGAYVQAWNYCPNCGAKMQPVGNSERLNTQTHADAIKNTRVQSNKEETHMYTKKFSSILDVIAAEIPDETVARWVSQWAMESEENSREVAEGLGYTYDD